MEQPPAMEEPPAGSSEGGSEGSPTVRGTPASDAALCPRKGGDDDSAAPASALEVEGAPASAVRSSVSRKSLLESLKGTVEGSSQRGGDDASVSGRSVCAADEPDDGTAPPWSWRGFAAFCGPGLLMSVAYLDPGNLEADIQAGAKTGFALLWWFALVSLGCGTAFQCLSGRIGLATGKDLARHCGERWPTGARWLLWVMLELAIVAVDIQETVGCAQALFMLTGGQLPLWAGCIVVSCSAFLLLLLERRGARWMEALFGSIIAVEAVAMAVNFFRAGVPAKEVALGLFRPTLPAAAIGPAVGALGALVMPYNLYFHSAVVGSRRPSPPTPRNVRGVLRYLRLETPLVLLGAFLINMCVICVFAQGFYGTPEADNIGLQSAGDLLAEQFGQQFKVFWAVGLLAAGQVSVIALTYAGQLVMAGLLRVEVKGWARMIATRLVALVPALTVALVSSSSNKFDSLNQMLNVVQSIQLPFALIPAIHMGACVAIMGPRGSFATTRLLTAFCGLITAAVMGINGYFLVLFRQDHLPAGKGVSAGWGLLMSAYYLALLFFAAGPDRVVTWAAPRAARLCSRAGAAAKDVAARARRGHWSDPESLLEIHL